MDIKNPADRGRWLGNPAQLYGIEKMTAAEGFDKGSAYYFVNNGAGLSYRLSADCALDIAALSYRGINIHFLTKNGYRSPYAFSHFESDFIHTFPAGRLRRLAVYVRRPAEPGGCFGNPAAAVSPENKRRDPS